MLSALREFWSLAGFMYQRHPLVFFCIVLCGILATMLLAALVPGSKYKKKIGSRKARRTLLPFLIVLMFACSIPPVLWYFGRLAPQENIRATRSKYVFGIDVSHYQGRIQWEQVRKSAHGIRYVFVRATMGDDGEDSQFRRNWSETRSNGFLRGAYHFFRPGEDAAKQFENFSSTVSIDPGDLPPVLDVESAGSESRDDIRREVKIWLRLAERKYGVRPIVYSGRNFYLKYLNGHLDGYPVWIAAYDGEHRVRNIDWMFHQFSESIAVSGVREEVDGNNFRGNLAQLKGLCLK